jgi:hypothetical protein
MNTPKRRIRVTARPHPHVDVKRFAEALIAIAIHSQGDNRKPEVPSTAYAQGEEASP